MNCITRFAAAVTLVFVMIVGYTGFAPAATLEEKIDAYVLAAHNVWKFSGSVLVAKDGRVAYKKAYGHADVELGVRSKPSMKYQIGSITKQFTAACILQLEERGLLSVEDPITRHLKDYPSDPGDRVTIHHLLSHTSGVPSYTDILDVWTMRSRETSRDDLIATFKDRPLEFEPGESWNYSNSGYFLLGAIIEEVSGMSYSDYLRKNILDPLGMSNTGVDDRRTILEGRARGYFLDDESGEVLNADFVHMSVPFSAGAMYSTVGDMLLWDRGLLGDRVLSDESKEKMFTPVRDEYGYGFFINNPLDRKCIHHGGGIDGFRSSFFRWVDDGVTVVVFSNVVDASTDAMSFALASIMFGAPYDVPTIKEPVAISPEKPEDYIGVFVVNETTNRTVTLQDGQLYSQRTGGMRRLIHPESEDKFFFDFDHTVTLTYIRDDAGTVIAHEIHQNASDARAEKMSDEEAKKILSTISAIEIDPELLNRYVGDYQLAPGFILTIRKQDDKLTAQATGQSEVTILPSSETEFFFEIVDAQITFQLDDSDEATSLILHQGGQDIPAPRIGE